MKSSVTHPSTSSSLSSPRALPNLRYTNYHLSPLCLQLNGQIMLLLTGKQHSLFRKSAIVEWETVVAVRPWRRVRAGSEEERTPSF